MKGVCPYCDKLKLGVNLFTNTANCFVCGNLGHPLLLGMSLEGFATPDQFKAHLKIYDGATYSSLNSLEKSYQKIRTAKVELPEGYKNILFGDSRVAKVSRNYWKRRGFNLTTSALKGIGYCDKGEYKGHIIIPFYLKGELIYFNARRIMYSGPKFNNPKEDDVGIGKSQVIYNGDALAEYKTVWLVESATNSLTIGSRAVGLGGKTISPTIYSTLVSSPVENFVIGLDRDAMLWATKLALQIIRHKRVKLIEPPDKRDWNDLGRAKALLMKKEASYLSYIDLIQRKHEYEESPEFTYN